MWSRSPFIEGPRLVAAAFPIAVLIAAGCGEEAVAPGSNSRLPDGGATESGTEPPGWARERPVTRKSDAPSPGGEGTEGGVSAPSPDAGAIRGCVPSPDPDVPDEDFADTNCDGMDGDASAAVFVSPEGSDDAEGARETPLKTLGEAVARARELGRSSIYACAGTYEENLELSQPIALYGGFDCERGWARLDDVALVRPREGTALKIAKGKDIALHSMAFQSANAGGPGESSIAVVVSDSERIVFERAHVVAGDGGTGADGKVASARAARAPAATPGRAGAAGGMCRANASCTALQGSSASDPACRIDSIGGSGEAVRCPDGTRVLGGAGGRGANCGLGLSGEAGVDGVPAASGSGEGRRGATGASGKPGGDFGRVVEGAYVPASGSSGRWGGTGTAGRGGDGHSGGVSGDVVRNFTIGGGGGQGGYPGCGGAGGAGGGGGGASIALLVERSSVRVIASRLVTGRGGDGGQAGLGGSGQPGGTGAPGAVVGFNADGAPGKNGGDGGQGGSGGPGGGGPSVGVVHLGDAPELDEATSFDLGEPGIGGAGFTVAPDGVRATTYDANVAWGVKR